MKKLYLTYCSAKKRVGIHPPNMLYISDRVTGFIERCKMLGVNWAILSALYAFFFPDEEKEDYNVTFQTDKSYWLGIAVVRDQHKMPHLQSKQHVLQLVKKVKQQANERHIDQIVFYAPSPKMVKCYLGVLHYAFDECSKSHGWQDLDEHVKDQSRTIKVVRRLANIR